MTLRAWSARHGFTYDTAAAALGVSRSTYRRLLHKAELPKLVQLAMRQIDNDKKTRGYCSMQGRGAA